jgi:hypothetical protein
MSADHSMVHDVLCYMSIWQDGRRICPAATQGTDAAYRVRWLAAQATAVAAEGIKVDVPSEAATVRRAGAWRCSITCCSYPNVVCCCCCCCVSALTGGGGPGLGLGVAAGGCVGPGWVLLGRMRMSVETEQDNACSRFNVGAGYEAADQQQLGAAGHDANVCRDTEQENACSRCNVGAGGGGSR